MDHGEIGNFKTAYSHRLLYRKGNMDYYTTYANSMGVVVKIKLPSRSFMEAIAKLRLLDPRLKLLSLIFMIYVHVPML